MEFDPKSPPEAQEGAELELSDVEIQWLKEYVKHRRQHSERNLRMYLERQRRAKKRKQERHNI